MKERRQIDKNELHDLYFEQGNTIKECQKIFQCSQNTIRRRFEKWGWKFRRAGGKKGRRHHKTRHIVQDIDNIKKLYDDGVKCKEIANKYNVSETFIERLLKDHKVELKNNNDRCRIRRDEFRSNNIDEINHLYLNDKLSTAQIASIYNLGDETIRRHLIDSGIKLRNNWEAQTKFTIGDIDELLKTRGYERLTQYDDFSKINRHDNKMELKCKKHGHVWSAKISNIIQGCGCPKCQNKSEAKVHSILDKILDVDIERQKYICSYKWGNKKCKIRVDFYFILNGIKYVIEYNGHQHYEVVDVFKNKGEKLEKQKYRDKSLKNYCEDNNTKLITIDGRYYKNLYMRQYKKRLKELEELLCAEFC